MYILAAAAALAAVSAGVAALNAGRIISFSVNAFTGYTLTYDRWKGNPLAKSELYGLELRIKGKDFSVSAERGYLDLDLPAFLKDRKLHIEVRLKDAVLASPPLGKEGMDPGDNVLSEVFKAREVYDEVAFVVWMGPREVKIEQFIANSGNIRLQGDYSLQKDKDVIDLDLKLSFSPQIAGSLPQEVRENVLSPDEGGWYSTVINYKGNPIFLKALYSIAF